MMFSCELCDANLVPLTRWVIVSTLMESSPCNAYVALVSRWMNAVEDDELYRNMALVRKERWLPRTITHVVLLVQMTFGVAFEHHLRVEVIDNPSYACYACVFHRRKGSVEALLCHDVEMFRVQLIEAMSGSDGRP